VNETDVDWERRAHVANNVEEREKKASDDGPRQRRQQFVHQSSSVVGAEPFVPNDSVKQGNVERKNGAGRKDAHYLGQFELKKTQIKIFRRWIE
jgi:hypothetical protein